MQFGGEGWGSNVTAHHDYTIRVHNAPSIALRAVESVIYDNLRPSNPWFQVGMEEQPDFEAAYTMDAQVMEQVDAPHRRTLIAGVLQLPVSHCRARASGVALLRLSHRNGKRVHNHRHQPSPARASRDIRLPFRFFAE